MDALRAILEKRKQGMPFAGIPSFCTANELAIEACLRQALRFDDPVLVEATANQVNQFGGYTGMTPANYRDLVYRIADGVGFPREKIILGGDHLGPLTWQSEPEEIAMGNAAELVRQFVEAGFKKIHLDTSMRLSGDPASLPVETVARRGAALYAVCEAAYQELRKDNPQEARPAFIIGSEVPIPGGAQEAEDSVSVTEPEAVRETLRVYREQFVKRGLDGAFDNIIGIVVQPGVEFGDGEVFRYDRAKAAALVRAMREQKGIVMEGHSTDYQPPQALKEMVEDGIAILKVGPALTFALREGLFALSEMERLLLPEAQWARFPEALEAAMLREPDNWKKYYSGTEAEQAIKRKFSFSDRCRYYFAKEEVGRAVEKLFCNLSGVAIPMGLLHQYLPNQYAKVRAGTLPPEPRRLAGDCVVHLVEDYNYATKLNYMIADALLH